MVADRMAAAGLSRAGRSRRRFLGAGTGLGLLGVLGTGAAPAWAALPAPLQQPASQTGRASRAVLTRVVRAGDRLVALGERGVVVLSDDGGRRWRQARVPVSVTLTAASFASDQLGWIAGHGGVVLHTVDGGETWRVQTDGVALAKAALAQAQAGSAGQPQRERQLQQAQRLVDEGPDKPLLGICFADERRGIAVGAYGLAAVTGDGGNTWVPYMDRLPNPRGMHLYAAAQHGRTWVLAGEQGLLIRSSDDRASYEAVSSPFKRSFFTATATRNGGFVLAGLLGAAGLMEQGESALVPITLPAPLTVLASTELRDGRVLMLAQGGRLLVSSDGGADFKEQLTPLRGQLTSLAEAVDGGLVATGLNGVARLA